MQKSQTLISLILNQLNKRVCIMQTVHFFKN